MEDSNQQNENINLPNDFGVLNFIEHRIQEINDLTKAIGKYEHSTHPTTPVKYI
jgi:hypothetical protein